MGTLLAIYLTALFLAWGIGATKGRAGEGFLLGLALAWIGVLIAIFLTPTLKAQGRTPCPYCAEAVLPAAKLCPHCGSQLPGQIASTSTDGTY